MVNASDGTHGEQGPRSKRLCVLLLNVNPGLVIGDVQARLGVGPPCMSPKYDSVPFYRIANNVWLLHTDRTLTELSELLSCLPHPAGTMFVALLQPSGYGGLLPPDAWTWMTARLAESP